jgi:predicted NAD/FAD-binding protein
LNSNDVTHKKKLNIAVVGAGVAGLSSAWLLNKNHQVTVYEAKDTIGGHANTVDVPTPEGLTPIDTGFLVYNELNYPNLTALFKHLGVSTKVAEMSFGASLESGGFEYSGTNLNGIFGQRINALRPRFWRMLIGIFSFYKNAPSILDNPAYDGLTLGNYLTQENFSDSFINDHLLPMGAAIWSTTASEMKAYPAQAFVRFFDSHGLLALTARPQWRTVDGGSREYVNRLTEGYRSQILFGGVKSIKRTFNKVLVEDASGNFKSFDHIVLATHADEALRLLSDSNRHEQTLLGRWQYTSNRAVLHSDPAFMPKRRRVWSSWNFIGNQNESDKHQLCVTYWLNRLQSLALDTQFFLTLNPIREPKKESIIREFEYAHPFFDTHALSTQAKLWSLQGHRNTWYCGSYFGAGFHEDALQSGLAVAEELGREARPWDLPNMNDRLHLDALLPVATA